MVVYTCNPSYSGEAEIGSRFKASLGKVSMRPYLKNKLKKAKGLEALLKW
jgi:hypothetical protein